MDFVLPMPSRMRSTRSVTNQVASCFSIRCVLNRSRRGHVLVLLVIAISTLLGLVGLVLDSGLLTADAQNLQQAADAAALAAAMDLRLAKTWAQAEATATDYMQTLNGFADSQLALNIPPSQGAYAGRSGFIEIMATRPYSTRLIHILGASAQQTVSVRSVAGYEPSTAGAAVIVLDPAPSPLAVNGTSLTASYPALIGGLEVLGVGTVRVDGAVLVNTTWGGVDESGQPAGSGTGPPYGISCTPLVSLTKLAARDIRVVGGVDNPDNYTAFSQGDGNPLRANRLAVPDPYKGLGAPSLSTDFANVQNQLRGGVQVAGLPLVGAPIVLQPGVYEWIEVLSGQVVFQPGVYVIRSTNPLSGIALNIVGGTITADGVLFYVTNAPNYDVTTGAPDNTDGEIRPAAPVPTAQTPSAVINAGLPGSRFSPLVSASSPFDGMLLYQRRADPRPIVIVHDSLLNSGTLSGTIYAKWGHVLFTGTTSYDLCIVAGTARLVTALGMALSPRTKLPPAQDVYLVE